jgi:hypothetical protein
VTIEIHSAELEALILERMRSGAFHDLEDLLIATFQSSRPSPEQQVSSSTTSNGLRTGVELVAAMQASPYKEIEIEPERYRLPIRDVDL